MLPAEDVEKWKSRIESVGLSLDDLEELVRILKLPHQVKTITSSKYYSSSLTLNSFRDLIKETLAERNSGLVVNFLGALMPQGYEVDCGHHSPVVAYHPEQDLMLIADVWWECPIGWYSVPDVWKAVNTMDKDSKEYRGVFKITIEV